MSLERLSDARRQFDDAAAILIGKLQALQTRVAIRAAAVLGSINRDAQGDILMDAANTNSIDVIVDALRGVLIDPEWVAAIAEYMAAFDALETEMLVNARELGLRQADLEALGSIKAHFQRQTARLLTTASSFDGTLYNPLNRTISASVLSGGSFEELLSTVTNIIGGGENDPGALVKAVKGPVETIGALFERSSTQLIADELGSDIFFYQGRNIDTTRGFCRERSGHAWHKSEIEEWASLDWDGKVDGTDAKTIFVYLGGWYGDRAACRHVLVPIAQRDAPKEDLDRMRSKGLI